MFYRKGLSLGVIEKIFGEVFKGALEIRSEERRVGKEC